MFGENFQIHGADITGNTFANQKIESGQFNPPLSNPGSCNHPQGKGKLFIPFRQHSISPAQNVHVCECVFMCIYIGVCVSVGRGRRGGFIRTYVTTLSIHDSFYYDLEQNCLNM